MKNLILFVTLLFCNLSYSQYLFMLDEDHIWSVDINGSNFGDDPWIITEQISVSGSTVINGKTYKTIFNNKGETSCLVREENGIVYRYFETINDEIVMYDFTLEVGEYFTFFQHYDYCSFYGGHPILLIDAQVMSTSIQFIAGEGRKVIEFENFFQDEEIWIEGIGSIRGFDPVGVVWDVVDFTELVCFTNSTNTYFFNGANSCDNTTLGLSGFSENEIILYPNPVKNQSILKLPAEAFIDKLVVVDMNGRIIKEEIISKDYSIINNMDFPSGIYFYQVFSGNKLIKTERFVVN